GASRPRASGRTSSLAAPEERSRPSPESYAKPSGANPQREPRTLLLEIRGEDLEALGAAGQGGGHAVADLLADQGARQRGHDRDQPLLRLRFVRPHDLVGRLLAVLVFQLHGGPEGDPISGGGRVDHLRGADLGLQIGDARLAEALPLARGVVLRVLAEVAVGPRLRDGPHDVRPLLLEPLRFLPEPLEASARHGRALDAHVPITSSLRFTSARKPFRLPRCVRWTWSCGITAPSGPFTSMAAVASERSVTLKPRWAASRVVVSQHIWVMKPETITRSIPRSRSSDSSAVLVNAPGRCLVMTGSSPRGVTASWIARAGLPGTKVAAPGRRLSCTMWMTAIRLSRAQRRVSAMRATALGPSGSTTLPIGAKYSCWASMMRSAVRSMSEPLGVQRVMEAGCPPTSTFAVARRPRIQFSQACARFCSSTCFSSSARSAANPSGLAGCRSSVFTT